MTAEVDHGGTRRRDAEEDAFCACARCPSERSAGSRPFDRERDGFVLSEGAGILVFEELEHAKNRRATILAEMLGCGVSADGGHITQPDPNGVGAAKAMELALKDARIAPADVDYINAHGTSTPLGDKAETQAIKSVFGESAKSVSVSSTKSQLGHSLGASGGIEMALSVLALNRKLAPPTINYETPDPDCDLDYTPNSRQQDRYLMSTARFRAQRRCAGAAQRFVSPSQDGDAAAGGARRAARVLFSACVVPSVRGAPQLLRL